MAKDVFAEMLVQMKVTNRLLVAQLKGRMKQQEIVAMLATTGASVREIAEVLDTTPATVTTTLVRLKKRNSSVSQSNDD